MVNLIKQDITTLEVDCIVNAANNLLIAGGGVDGAIHRVAGPELQKECLSLNGCVPGEAKITKGYDLPCKYVIHTVGPMFRLEHLITDSEILANCYKNTLDLAKKKRIHSIAFPSIGTGIYSFPVALACKIALNEIKKWKNEHPQYKMDVTICCFNDETYNIYQEEVKNYGE